MGLSPYCLERLPRLLKVLAPILVQYRAKDNRVIYFLLNDFKLVYVGSTTCLEMRLSNHRTHGKVFDRVLFIRVDPAVDLKRLELSLIARLKPKLNKLYVDHQHFGECVGRLVESFGVKIG